VSRRLRPPTPLAPEGAWDYALLLLGRRALSSGEMRERLRRRGLPDADVERVLTRLLELKLLDDRVYAGAFVRSRAASRGRLALRQELHRRGLAETIVDEALAERTDDDQATAAAALLRKLAWRFEDAHSPDPDEARGARARAYALLARRGFPPDAAREAVDAVLPRDED
jgi:regulatory protein